MKRGKIPNRNPVVTLNSGIYGVILLCVLVCYAMNRYTQVWHAHGQTKCVHATLKPVSIPQTCPLQFH